MYFTSLFLLTRLSLAFEPHPVLVRSNRNPPLVPGPWVVPEVVEGSRELWNDLPVGTWTADRIFPSKEEALSPCCVVVPGLLTIRSPFGAL